MALSRRIATLSQAAALALLCVGVTAAAFLMPARAQTQPSQLPAQARVIVTGEGSVSVATDYAEITAGVSSRAKIAKEAIDANSKLMAAVNAALLDSGIDQKDIQTSRFSVQPVYVSPQPGVDQKLSGFSVSNQVSVKVRQIATVGAVLDRLIAAGANDVGNVEFLHSDPSKVLDQAREAAVVDARRKAELYARAAGLNLGPVAWITEDVGYAPPMSMGAPRMFSKASPVPISAGEDTMQVRITVGFAVAN